MIEMKKEEGKENIKNCSNTGKNLTECLQEELINNPDEKKQVVGSIKD